MAVNIDKRESFAIKIILDPDVRESLASIFKFLRATSITAAIRWAIVTAGDVCAMKLAEVKGRVALQAALDKTNQNTESTRFVDFSQALDTKRVLAEAGELAALAHMEEQQNDVTEEH